MRKLLFLAAFALFSCSQIRSRPAVTSGLKKVGVIKSNAAVLEIEKSDVPGIYEIITVGGHCYLVDSSGRYVFPGFIIDTQKPNLKSTPNAVCIKKARKIYYERALSSFPKTAIRLSGKGKPIYLIANLDRKETLSILNRLLLRKLPVTAVFYSSDQTKLAYILQASNKRAALKELIEGKYEKVKMKPATRKIIDDWKNYLDKYLLPTKEAFYLFLPSKDTFFASSDKNKIEKELPFDFTLMKEQLIKSAPVVVGNGGGKQVVVVVDPLCPFCRMSCNRLRKYAKEGKVTFYVYFLPVHGQASEGLIAKILNRPKKDRAAVLEKVFSEGLKAGAEPFNPQSAFLLKKDLEMVSKLSVSGTPTFFFLGDGKIVNGANLKEIIKEIEK